MYQITKYMVDFRRNQFLNQGLQTEFTIQSEHGYRSAQQNRNKLVSVGSQLKNLNNIEKNRYLKPDSSYEECSGESSVICDQYQQKCLSIEQVQQMVIDTSINQAIKLEPKALQKKYKIDSYTAIVLIKNGNHRNQLSFGMLMSMPLIKQTLMSFSLISIDIYELRFKDKSFIQFKKIELGSFEGKLVIIIRMKEDKSAQYVYYNLVTSTHRYKKIFGEQIEVSVSINAQYFQLKVSEKLPNKNEITVIMRFFPIQFNNEKLQSLQDMRAEELFIYQGYKYGIFKTKDFETAENYRNNLLRFLNQIILQLSIQQKYQDAHITIMEKKKQKNLNYKVFFEDDCINPRLQLEQKLGISLSPPKIIPQNIINQQDQQQVTLAVIQPTISAMYNSTFMYISKISKEENLSKGIPLSEVKQEPTEKIEQKIMIRPVQLKPVIIQIERDRSSRKKRN